VLEFDSSITYLAKECDFWVHAVLNGDFGFNHNTSVLNPAHHQLEIEPILID
jgi:hypothetical protein